MKHSHSPLRRAVASAVAFATRLAPPRRTFQAIILMNRAIARFAPRPRRAARIVPRYRIDGPRETRLFRVLDTVSRYGGSFDPVIRMEGEEHLQAALARHGGVLLLGGHTMLNVFIARYMHDRQIETHLFAGRPFPIPGTQQLANTQRPSPMALLRATRALRRGAVVCALVDRAPTNPDRVFDIAESLFHLALKLRTNVLFFASHAGEKAIEMKLEPPAGNPGAPEELIAAFSAFLHARIAATAPQFRD
jgi:lauroyl/myristoyl acyltransferase